MEFLTTFVNGLSLGGIYAMIALGYTMVYGIAKMLNFAHGDIIMVGGYTILVFLPVNPIVALIVSVLFCVFLGISIEKLAYKPLRGSSPLAVLITAIGVSNLLQSVAQISFGSATKFVNIAELGTVSIGSFSIYVSTIVTLITSVIVMVALTVFIKYSKIGRAMRAVSEDGGAARLMGINTNVVIAITFAIGSALAALASICYLLKSPAIMPQFGAMPGIKAFTAAVIGGIGSIPGAMVGGILLGIIECFCQSFTAISPYTDAIEFAILIVILLVKPNGLFGRRRSEKV